MNGDIIIRGMYKKPDKAYLIMEIGGKADLKKVNSSVRVNFTGF